MRWSGIFALFLVFAVACSDSDSASAVEEPIDEPTLPFVRSAPVLFTEVNPKNNSFEDEDGDKSDWIELFNPADSAVSLAGYSLTNDLNEPHKWTFGDVKIPAQGFLIVFFSKKNRPDYAIPSDSINMLGGGAWGWSDAQSSPVAGTSFAKPWLSSRYLSKENGANVLSGQMQLGENEELGWSSACIFVGVGTGSRHVGHDLSKTNQSLLTGFVTKNEELELRLTQTDLDDWKGWPTKITGTGDSSTTYLITLPTEGNFPDLKNIYGSRFSAVNSYKNPVQFKFTSFVARNQGHFPHTNFKLPQEGGNIFLLDSTGTLRDSIAYPKVPNGKSYSFAGSGWGFATPNPMEFSLESYAGQAVDSYQLPASGFYSVPFTISFGSDPLSGIHCEAGGKLPTELSPTMLGDLTISTTTVLRCATFHEGMIPSEILTRTYIFEPQPSIAVAFITADPNQLFSPDSGLYEEGPNASSEEPHYGANYWLDKTIPADLTFFEPGSTSPAFEISAGYEIFGNYSRANPKKSFALKFRKKYGSAALEYRIFPEHPDLKRFKDLVFRNNGGNWSQDYLRDRLGSSITRGLGVDYQKARPSVVYYNGEYYGIHNIRERLNENYFTTNYGISETAIDLLKCDQSATAGSPANYVELEEYVKSHDLADSAAFAYVATQMDVDNYTNYIQTEIYIANQDWPANNMKMWRSRAPQTKWKWILYDLDFGFNNGHSQYSDIDMFHFILDSTATGYPNGKEYTVLIRNLLKNENYRNRFVNRFSALLAGKFSADSVIARERLLMQEISSEISHDQERWNHSSSYMESHVETIEEFATSRPAEVLSEMQSVFELGKMQTIAVEPNGCGTILVDGIPLRQTTELKLFADVPVTLSVENGAGCTFSGWTDGETSLSRTILPMDGNIYVANFR